MMFKNWNMEKMSRLQNICLDIALIWESGTVLGLEIHSSEIHQPEKQTVLN